MPDQTGASTATQHAHIEDPFFVLRDCRELFQRRLGEIVRQSGISSPAVIAAFNREIGEAHDELASSAQQDGFEQTNGLTASRITLVGNDDLELDIRIGDIANHLRSNDRIDHWRAQLRYMTLLRRPKMTMENNPVGLEPIRRGLWVLCKESGNNLDQNLDRLTRLEEQLQLLLPDAYAELNDLLERHHIEPAQVHIVQKGSGSKPAAGSGAGLAVSESGGGGGAPSSNALASLQQAMQQQFGTNAQLPAEKATNQATGSAGNFTLNASTLVMLNHLMERLRVLELQQVTGLSSFLQEDSNGPDQLRALKSKDLDLPLGTPPAIALDTLSLIFEAMFAAPDLPDAVKTAISRLQIPLLKLAILDPSFFANAQHPARHLINRMARAAVGLAPDTGRDHPVCASLRKLADAVRVALETNDGNLAPHLAELEVLIADRDRLLQANSEPYVQLVLEHEAAEVARNSAQAWLLKTLGKTTEPSIRKFLAEFWLRVMQAACGDGGTGGTRWKECDVAIEELLWSIEPKQSPEDRKKLLALIPSLIKRINTGLDLLGISTEARAPFLNTCFDLQTAALRNRPDTADIAATTNTPAPASEPLPFVPSSVDTAGTVAPAADQILERGGKLVQYLERPTANQSSWRNNGNAWKESDWISFLLPDGERLCGRHCWQGMPFGTVVLFNSGWGYAVAIGPSVLEQQLRGGQARIASETSIFDEAAEQALGQITPR